MDRVIDTSFIHGVIPPIVTPVDHEDRVDAQAMRAVVEHVIAGGVHGILSLGSNGEFFSLDHEQQQRAVTITVDQAGGRIPVYMGIGAIATRECIRMARMAEQIGVSAITVLPPMFLTLTEEELYAHFRSIADAVALPVLLYNNPDRVGNNISPKLLERLVKIPNLVGIKDSSGDLTLTAEYIRRTRDSGFSVLAGRDVMILGSLVYGAVGCVASTANIVPALVVDIYNKYKSGDLIGAREAQFKLAPLRMAFNLGSFPVVTKDAMRLMGLDVGQAIKPITSCSDANLHILKGILSAIE